MIKIYLSRMEMLADYGLFGLFLASFAAATIIPFSSEAILLAVLASGMDPWLCVFTATLGNTAGGMTSYGLGYVGNWGVLEKYFRVNRERAGIYRDRISKYGFWFALLCWTPFIGDVIAIALGLFRVRATPVFLLMLLGKFARYLFVMQAYLFAFH